LDRLAEERQIEQEVDAPRPRQVSEVIDPALGMQEQAVAGQVLGVADHRPTRPQAGKYRRVLAALRGAAAIAAPSAHLGRSPTAFVSLLS
jgi:hypothetical protein